MHDQFIRAIFSDKVVAADYFQAFLPEVVRERLDFSTPIHLPETYLSKDLRKTMSVSAQPRVRVPGEKRKR